MNPEPKSKISMGAIREDGSVRAVITRDNGTSVSMTLKAVPAEEKSLMGKETVVVRSRTWRDWVRDGAVVIALLYVAGPLLLGWVFGVPWAESKLGDIVVWFVACYVLIQPMIVAVLIATAVVSGLAIGLFSDWLSRKPIPVWLRKLLCVVVGVLVVLVVLYVFVGVLGTEPDYYDRLLR
jgi:hypothetical protein